MCHRETPLIEHTDKRTGAEKAAQCVMLEAPQRFLLLSLLLALFWARLIAREDSRLNHLPSVPMSTFRSLQLSVTPKNCAANEKVRLRLPHGVVAQLPEFNSLDLSYTFLNRTGLLHVHNMALNRAFFFSYILQNFNQSKSDANNLPGLLYLYLSATADVTANPKNINGSTLLYDLNSFYPNWFESMKFNTTFNLFGVRAIRTDNTFSPINFLREPNLKGIKVFDLGAQNGDNYTHASFKNAPWYGMGPDDPRYIPEGKNRETTGSKKHSFNFDIHWEPGVRVGKSFFGPPYAGQLEGDDLPVRFTQPWYNCAKSGVGFNEWVVSSVSPVVDFMPRYGQFINMVRPKYVAVAAMDTFMLKIPINLCPIALGNPDPNLLAGSDMCRPTTICEPRMMSGPSQFVGGSYFCRCAAGYRYPMYRGMPYSGSEIRSSTREEYEAGFNCVPIGNQMVWPSESSILTRGSSNAHVKFTRRRRAIPQEEEDAEDATVEDEQETVETLDKMVKGLAQEEANRKVLGSNPGDATRLSYVHALLKEHLNSSNLDLSLFSGGANPPKPEQTPKPSQTPKTKPKLTSRFKRSPSTQQQNFFDRQRLRRMEDIFTRVEGISEDNCASKHPDQLILPGSVAFGAERQYHGSASMALRLAHFLSAFLQINRPDYVVGGLLLGQTLHEHHIIGETLANVAGDTEMVSSGVFFDRSRFVDSKGTRRVFFGPMVYRKGSLASGSFEAKDMANFGGYAHKDWFNTLKQRWASNSYGLEKFTVLPDIRANFKTSQSINHPDSPMTFWAPRMEDGMWTAPYFDCTGPVKSWLLTFAVPFFGRQIDGTHLEFRGVVTATVNLGSLNINQCPGKFYEANFFKDTALCDTESTYCVPGWGEGFTSGSYECHCRMGFEYPFYGTRFFYIGSFMEREYRRMVAGKPNLYQLLKCRESGGARNFISFTLTAMATVISSLFISWP